MFHPKGVIIIMELSKSVTAALTSTPKKLVNFQNFIPNCLFKWLRVTTTIRNWLISETRIRRCQFHPLRKCPLQYLENTQLTIQIIALKSTALQVLKLILPIGIKYLNSLVRKGICTLEKTRAPVMVLLPFFMGLKAILSNKIVTGSSFCFDNKLFH